MLNNKKGKDASYVNRLNKIEVLNLIRESKEISRADIVKKLHLSAPTVTRIVEGLISDNLAIMVGEGDSTGGRPPKLIRFDGSQAYVIGVDLGSTSIRAAISNLNGKIIIEIETPTDLEGGFKKICWQVSQLLERLITRSKLDDDEILGVGLAVAGFIRYDTGLIEYSPVFNWRKVNLKSELRKHLKMPIFYDNVTRVTALGELVHGIGKKHKNFICINAGYGIGAGIIINGAPFFGSRGFASEFGHIIVDDRSDYVGKGSIQGSLEALASGYGIAEAAKRRLQKTGTTSSRMIELAGGSIGDITAKHVFDSAKEGDSIARATLDEAFSYWGIGLDTLIKLFNPEAIVVAGGLIRSGKYFFEGIQRNLIKHKLAELEDEVPLLPSSFGDDATIIGSLSLVTSKVLQFDQVFAPKVM